MSSPIKISEAASLALHTMALLAASGGRKLSAREAAAAFGVSESHLAKVLQRMAKHGLAISQRGPGGGFTLAKPADQISLLDIYQASEGPLQGKACLLGGQGCGGACLLGDLLSRLDRQISEYFTDTKLSEVSKLFQGEQCHA